MKNALLAGFLTLSLALTSAAWGAPVTFRKIVEGPVTAVVPEVRTGNPSADATMNDALRALMAEEVRRLSGGETPQELVAAGTLELASRVFFSFSFESTVFFEGAAHPFSHGRGITFDATTGRSVTLEELFAPGADWSRILNALVASTIDRQVAAGELMVLDAPHPDVATYGDQFFLRPGHLVLFWTDGQFSPHASGQPEFPLPLTALRRQGLTVPNAW